MTVYGKTTEDIESGQVMAAGHKSSGNWFWKLCSALSLLAVCAILGLLFTWQMKNQEQKSAEIPAYMPAGQPEVPGQQQTLKQIADKVKAGIHVEGLVNEKRYDSSVEWSVKDGHSFFQGGLTLENNEIVIPRTGLYFVYSQASFRVLCGGSDDSQEQRNKALSHMVLRFSTSYGGEKPLLSTVKSPCGGAPKDSDTGDQLFSSIYLGAVFKLQRGDRLRTETNWLRDIDSEDGKTFFGVFAL